jgi:hypothetical protein
MPAPAKQNYLNNKDLLREIHKSKMSYCYIEDPQYFNYNIIVDNLEDITPDKVHEAKEALANQIQSEKYAQAMTEHDMSDYRNKPKQKDFAVNLDDIDVEELVFRVMTYKHIPDAPGRKKNPKTEAEEKEKLNFVPFKHYAFKDGVLTEVVRSHWKGDLETGEFCATHGSLTHNLAKMFIKLVERYSHRANWRSYTYIDEMKGHALYQLSDVALKFNEQRSDNPFGYYTQTVNNSFTQILNLEKKQQSIRDNILVDQGHMPSYTRQLEHEEEVRQMRENAENEENADY